MEMEIFLSVSAFFGLSFFQKAGKIQRKNVEEMLKSSFFPLQGRRKGKKRQATAFFRWNVEKEQEKSC